MRRPTRKPTLEILERRDLLALTLPGFLSAAGFGVTGISTAIHANAVATDPAGNTVVTGSFRGTVNFNPAGTGPTFTSAGTQDTFVARFGPTGGLLWVRTFAGQMTTSSTGPSTTTTYAVGQGSAVTLDTAGNIFLTGSFQGTVNFGTTAQPSLQTSAGSTAAYVAELDGMGNLGWIRSLTPQGGDDQGLALTLDRIGGVIVAGTFAGGASVGSTTLIATGASEAFVARFASADGTPTWGYGTRGTAGSNAQATGVAVDSAGNVVLAGFYSGSVTLGSGTSGQTYTAAGSTDAVVWKLGPSGQLVWGRSFGSTDYDVAGGLAVDSADNIAVAGTFSGSVNFATGSKSAILSAGPIFSAFALQLDPLGQTNWARGFTASSGWSKGQAIAVDSRQGIHLAGAFSGTTDFDPGPTWNALTSQGSTDAFAAGLDATGRVVYAIQAGQTNFNANLGVAVNPSGDVALTGTYSGSIGFGSIALPATGKASAFVARVQSRPTAATTPPSITPASLTGLNNTTSVTNPTFNVTATDSVNTVRLLRDGVIVAQRVGNGSLTDAGPVSAGVHVYTTVQVSLAGIESANSSGTTVTFITTPPAAPTGLALLRADDSGALGDSTTNVRTPHVTGKAGAGLTIQVISGSGVVLASTTSAGDGAFTISLPTLSDGTYPLRAVASDAAANLSPFSLAFNLTILTRPPATPGTPTLPDTDDSGTIGDGITKVRNPRITGKASAGVTVQIVAASGSVLASTTAGGDGTYLATLPVLADGSIALQAVAIDAAANVSSRSSPLNLTIVTTTPPTPTGLALLAVDDSGTIGDGKTNVRTPRITGKAGAGLTVQVVASSGLVLATTRASTDGIFTATLTSLADGSYAVQAVATDAAANVSSRSSPLNLTIVTTTPPTPTGLALLAVDDSGTIGDGKTNVRTPRITGKAGSGLTIQVVSASGVVLATTASASDGTFTVSLPSLADGSTILQAVGIDAAGNTSLKSAPLSLTIQTKPPATPGTPSLPAADDSGTIGDGKTNVRSPRLTVSVGSGLAVRLINGGGGIIGTGTASVGGVITIAVGPNLADGTYSVRAITVDDVGNLSAPSPALSLVIAAAMPATLAGPMILAVDDTGIKGDGLTTVRRPRINGVATPGNRVDWIDASGSVIASTTAAAGSGAYVLQAAQAFANGTTLAQVRQVDDAGNVGPASRSLTINVRATSGDYFADGQTDVSVYRPSTNIYYIAKPATGTLYTQNYGEPGDIPISGDFFGDGSADLAIYRPSIYAFFILDPSSGASKALQWGGVGDIPVSGDYDGDGKTDIAVFRPSAAVFYVQLSSTGGLYAQAWGGPGDIPVPGDYDGDGKTDIALYRPGSSVFYVRQSSTGGLLTLWWGGVGDTPVPADYDGDGKTDIAIYRPSNNGYYVRSSSTGNTIARAWGLSGDLPVAGDYFGSGRSSFTVYRPGNSGFYSNDPITSVIRTYQFGGPGDWPIQAPLTSRFNLNGSPRTTANLLSPLQPASSILPAPVDFVPAPIEPAVSQPPRSAARVVTVDRALADLGMERWRVGSMIRRDPT